MEIPVLIKDLALILAVAGITTLLFKKLKQPVVLGYIIAGLLVGPKIHLVPTVTDVESIRTWANIGVIFLLFALGLEFSFKKLIQNGSSSAIAGFFEIICMMTLGYFTGKLIGWPEMDCIFLGGIIAISSTTIVIRALNESGFTNRRFAGVVLGILIIEDIAAVLLLVLLSTLAVSRNFEGTALLFSLIKLLFFLCCWFLAGIFILPTVLKKTQKLMNDETLLIVSIGLCLTMVVLATKVGFSSALGAFVMGSMLAETTKGKDIEKLVQPIKDLFGAVFFVSVGMLIDPQLLWQYAAPVLLISFVVIIGKTVNVTLGALLSGQALRQSVQSGFSLAQIGEFSFIIATLGMSLNVTSSYLYPIVVGVSVITTFTTPYMIRLADPVYGWLQKHLPVRFHQIIDRYSTGAQTIGADSKWKTLLKAYFSTILINGVVIIAITLASATFLRPFISEKIQNSLAASLITVSITLTAVAPFVWALMVKRAHKTTYTELWLDKKYNRGPLVMLEILRNVLAVLLVGVLFRQFFPFGVSIALASVMMVIVLLVFSEKLQTFYHRIEKRFIKNLHAKKLERYAEGAKDLSPWDAHLAYFEVHPRLPYVGKTLADIAWREQYGINIASIERGGKIIQTPGSHDIIFPHDKLSVIGTDSQLQAFTPMMETLPQIQEETIRHEIILDKIIINSTSLFRGKSVKESGIREMTRGLVVGIERNEERILNPSSKEIFQWGDIVWIVGERRKIKKF